MRTLELTFLALFEKKKQILEDNINRDLSEIGSGEIATG
jgi:hypothetical protein